MEEMDPSQVRYVFLDRDGVLNRKMPEGTYVTDWAQFQWLAGADEAIARMNRAGLTVILVSNQRGIALGLYTEAQLEHIHGNMQSHLARHGAWLDAVYYCPHDYGECHCRKPDVGLFEQAFKQFPRANAQNSVVIGDSLSDIEAGRRLGMKTVFVLGEADRQKAGAAAAAELADAFAGSLLQAVEMYLGLVAATARRGGGAASGS
jgi:D-glycero-D-manno-heptose 1,7-bisphosphate phosphatase